MDTEQLLATILTYQEGPRTFLAQDSGGFSLAQAQLLPHWPCLHQLVQDAETLVRKAVSRGKQQRWLHTFLLLLLFFTLILANIWNRTSGIPARGRSSRSDHASGGCGTVHRGGSGSWPHGPRGPRRPHSLALALGREGPERAPPPRLASPRLAPLPVGPAPSARPRR